MCCARATHWYDVSVSHDGFKQCESCVIAWKHLDTSKCGRCVNGMAPNPSVVDPHKSMGLYLIVFNKLLILRLLFRTPSRYFRSHPMDDRLRKQPVAQQLHTTAATSSVVSMCIKSASSKDQKNTDPSFGRWGKPWSQDVYLSGGSYLLRIV